MAKTSVTYTATADFNFKLNRRSYGAKAGEVFPLPEELTEVVSEPDIKGIRFQYAHYLTTINDETGDKTEMELPHYMILPLTRS